MKAITADNYIVRPFLTHKTQEVDYVFLGGSNPSQLSIDVAKVTPTVRPWVWNVGNEQKNLDGLYARPLYASVLHTFYGVHTGRISSSSLDLKFNPVNKNLYVINIAQQAFGETVRAGSFQISSPLVTTKLYDDGYGRIVSTANPSKVVGNIFYGAGVAIVEATSGSVISVNGMTLTTGSALEVTFDASHTIYEHQVLCTMDPGEFNYSLNPSIRRDGTAAILDKFASGTLTPYMTTVGLYTDVGELVALGKFPRPIKRVVNSQQTVVVRLDI